ncbi:MAG: translation initiation factor IF-2 [Endomicrobium sp.]|jgi:translation initiation factor IF-2|nr:translation initiation factor IF-2 [Endomicrobium sp.]
MPLKRVTKLGDSEEKNTKKKITSSEETKTKSTSTKKTAVLPIKRTVKVRIVSKKTNLKHEIKTVKPKMSKRHSSNKIVQETDYEKKKNVLKRVEKKYVVKKEKRKKEVLKEQQKSVIIHEIKPIVNISIEEKEIRAEQFIDKSDKLIGKNDKNNQITTNTNVNESQAEQKSVLKIETSASKQMAHKYKDVILINELITVKILAEKMNLRVGDVLKKLLSMGSLATINQRLDTDTAILLANEFDYDAKMESIYSEDKISVMKAGDPAKLKKRCPVITIMGHVDHGKTSLLDCIRSSNVVAGEQGGITQHIGAYKVKTPSGDYITFLDTPGHEAFTAMRSRGTQVTDIVVLVVSAVDGVKPQTIEAINHAKVANVPIIVAVNKIDLPYADPQKIRQELSNYGLIPEEWGGNTIMVDISAKQKININSLLEMILLKAEMMELKANPDENAEGIVVEARLDSRKGSVATLLVQNGALKIGDNLVVGTTYGKVRALVDEYGKRVIFALPGTPVGVLGINELPQAGDKFIVVEHESQAREIAQTRREKAKEASLKSRHHLSLTDISMRQSKDLRIILKTDVQGSLGALSDSLERLSSPEISLKIIHKGSGAITESDIDLAVASDSLIVGFNLRPDAVVEKLAESEKVSINVYRVIYDLISDIKAAMEGMLEPTMKENILGNAIVKQVFRLSSFGVISGCSVTDGKIQRGAKVRLLRDNVIIFEGNISSLKRFKDDVKEVEKGYECGISIENFSDVKVGDVIENFTMEKIARKLEDN